ncbi:MAG: hypothetical protein MJ181_04725 [Treponema sp.]|nr:hypothetical protein [Treponema sp.]
MKKSFRISLIILISIPLILCAAFLSWLYIPRTIKPKVSLNKEKWNTSYRFVFCHGFQGWGSYDERYKSMPYWGMLNGDLMAYLKSEGFDSYAASVDPIGSAWDRACELYAQLTGTRVDYGKAHSEEMGHERFGKDFTGQSLVPAWNSKDKINILGHSFGGATIRTLISLLDKGEIKETSVTPAGEVSPLFTGGKADWIYSVITLAAPHNGTSAYYADPDIKFRPIEKIISESRRGELAPADDKRSEKDFAAHDMHLDRAKELNETLSLPENLFYFSIPCSSSIRHEDGSYTPDRSRMEIFYRADSERMGHYTGVGDGITIGMEWRENDGLVNTFSATYPFGQPHCEYVPGRAERGMWNIMPVYKGDHMSLQGGMFKRNDVRKFYAQLLDEINQLQ